MDNVLPFERTQEAFTARVIVAMPDGTYAAAPHVAIHKALVVNIVQWTSRMCVTKRALF
jgi:hypothetical protein